MKNIAITFLAVLVFGFAGQTQTITYSPPLDANAPYFTFIGKHKDTILTYVMQNTGLNQSQVYMYDDSMHLLQKVVLPVPPDIFGVQLTAYDNFFYLFFQQQQKDSVCLQVAKIDMEGNMNGNIITLDKTFAPLMRVDNKIYSIAVSENKQYFTAFKINASNNLKNILTTLLFDEGLQLMHTSVLAVPAVRGQDFLTEFNTDNDGDLVFMRVSESDSTAYMVEKTVLIMKKALADDVTEARVIPGNIRLDDIHIKVDNLNSRYILASLYEDNATADVDGLYCLTWSKKKNATQASQKIMFDDSLRVQASIHGKLKRVFDNLFIQNIILRKDGSFVVDAGFYTAVPYSDNRPIIEKSRPSFYNQPGKQFTYFAKYLPCGYMFYLPGFHFPWNAWSIAAGNRFSFSSGNIMAFSLDSVATLGWIKYLDVSQFSYNPFYMGYSAQAANNKIYYLYNQIGRDKSFLAAQAVNTDGTVDDGIMFMDIDRTIQYNVQFIPRSIIRLGNKEIVLACQKSGKIYLAKILL